VVSQTEIEFVRRLRRVDESTMSSRISPPGVGELSRRFEDTVLTRIKIYFCRSDHLQKLVW
jgi:hypothetical protein